MSMDKDNKGNKDNKDNKEVLEVIDMDEQADVEKAGGEKNGMKKAEKKEKAPKSRMEPKRKKKIIRRCVILGAVSLAAGWFVFQSVMAKNAKPPVSTTSAVRGDVEETLSTSGTVVSEISKTYYAPAEVAIRDLSISLGDAVKKGDKLCEYNTDKIEFAKEKADLQVKSSGNGVAGAIFESQENEVKKTDAENNLANVEPMILSQKQYIENLETYLEDAQSRERVKLYNEQYKVQKELNSLSEEQSAAAAEGRKMGTGVLENIEHESNKLEEISLKLKLLEEDREMTEIERNIVREKNKLTDLEEFRDKQKSIKESSETQVLNGYEKGKLNADHQLVKLEVSEAEKDLAEALNGVTADFDGIVTELSAKDGSWATPEEPILTLESSTDVKVTFNVSKYDLEKLDLGQKADVNISGHMYEGTVTKINRMATRSDAGTPVVMAEVHIENPDDYVYLGVEAKLVIHTAKSENALSVPLEAIATDREGNFCYIVENGMVVKKRLTTGISSESMTEIKEGLKEGDQIVLDMNGVMEGMEVMAVPADGGAAGNETEAATAETETAAE